LKRIVFSKPIHIISTGTAVGSLEKHGPLGHFFDLHSEDDRFGNDTWEKSESESQHLALNAALAKAKLRPDDIDAVFAGDLINQCTGSSFGLLDAEIPYFGLYGACSTIAEGLLLASVLLDSGHAETAAAVTSSHYCSAERQFRTPLEYGAQRSPTSQRTVTGAGAFVLSSNADMYGSGKHSRPAVRIVSAMPGKVTDGGITDQSNMGAAMAPAALRTLCDFFKASKTGPDDYDLIVTGDLGFEGHRILRELSAANGYELNNCTDCGLLIYERSSDNAGALSFLNNTKAEKGAAGLKPNKTDPTDNAGAPDSLDDNTADFGTEVSLHNKIQANDVRANVPHTAESQAADVRASVPHTAKSQADDVRANVPHTAKSQADDVRANVTHTAESQAADAHANIPHTAERQADDAHANVPHTAERQADDVRANVPHTAESQAADVRVSVPHTVKSQAADVRANVPHTAESQAADVRANVTHTAKSKAPDVHAGGSGCGCSATVLASYLLSLLEESPNGCMPKGRMLFMATGALMSPLTVMQGQSIPGIAHLIELART